MNLAFFLIYPLLIFVSSLPPTPFDVGCWNVHKNSLMWWFKNAFLFFFKMFFCYWVISLLVFLLYNICKLNKFSAATSLKLGRWNLAYMLLLWAFKIKHEFFLEYYWQSYEPWFFLIFSLLISRVITTAHTVWCRMLKCSHKLLHAMI